MRNLILSRCKNNQQFVEHWVQLSASVKHKGTVNTSITAGSTDRKCVRDVVVGKHDSPALSFGLESTALRVAIGKGNLSLLCYFMGQGADVNIPFAR